MRKAGIQTAPMFTNAHPAVDRLRAATAFAAEWKEEAPVPKRGGLSQNMLCTVVMTPVQIRSLVRGTFLCWRAINGMSSSGYQRLTDRMVEYVNSASGRRVIAAFRRYSDNFRNAALTDLKIIDLVLWQNRWPRWQWVTSDIPIA
jgi:hypothetical protein